MIPGRLSGFARPVRPFGREPAPAQRGPEPAGRGAGAPAWHKHDTEKETGTNSWGNISVRTACAASRTAS